MNATAWRDDAVYPYPHCGRPDCQCTHTECVMGQIETFPLSPGGGPAVRHCPVCHPDRVPTDAERADQATGRQRWQKRLQRSNIHAARQEKQQSDTEEW